MPFALTRAQQKVYGEISRDLAQPHPMQRLLRCLISGDKPRFL
ncbi:MAG: hypothetical protein Q8P42_14460 [Gallionella sp.]|nr:hypothetical protein [Gallionella sp.]